MEQNLTYHSIIVAEIKTRDSPPPSKKKCTHSTATGIISCRSKYILFNQSEQITLFLSSHFYVLTFVNSCRIYRLFQFGRMISVDECGVYTDTQKQASVYAC
jgi:hypothetical protein